MRRLVERAAVLLHDRSRERTPLHPMYVNKTQGKNRPASPILNLARLTTDSVLQFSAASHLAMRVCLYHGLTLHRALAMHRPIHSIDRWLCPSWKYTPSVLVSTVAGYRSGIRVSLPQPRSRFIEGYCGHVSLHPHCLCWLRPNTFFP